MYCVLKNKKCRRIDQTEICRRGGHILYYGGVPVEHSVQLGTQYYRESICARLLELREREKLPFQIIEHQQGKRWIIKCHLNSFKIGRAHV